MGDEATYTEFTEAGYRELLRIAKGHYAFSWFGDYRTAEAGSVLWRHDLDFSVHRALALARIEAEEDVRATYFLSLHSPFYNALEGAVTVLVDEILGLGHELGVHFDPTFHAGRRDFEQALAGERGLLAELFGREPVAFSLHNPDVAGWADERDEIAGMVNAYGAYLRSEWGYASDSNGYWRFLPLREVLESGEHERLHVLTHPEWWVPGPLSPRERVSRAIDGRAAHQHERYDRAVASMGRTNVGR